MNNIVVDSGTVLDSKWFEALDNELLLPVAPACNMMCRFCSKNSDCISNGNNPESLSRVMTPRQAVRWAAAVSRKNRKIKVLKISGPGEPLCNVQTFEVLRRLKYEMPDFVYCVSTNGLLLEEKADELAAVGVRSVDVSMNAFSKAAAARLYSRVIKGSSIITSPAELADCIYNSQTGGIKRCMDMGIKVKINAVYFPGVNDGDIDSIAVWCLKMGIENICLIAGMSPGKFSTLRLPSISELIGIQQKLLKVIKSVQVKSFVLPVDI
jgi:nitrogen fixation protein NifB